MKATIYLLSLFIILFSECHAESVEWISVASNSDTLIEQVFQGKIVQIKVTTHETDIGKASDGLPEKLRNNCTYTRYPCSLVDDIEIFVNGQKLFVPRSVFSDSADLFRMAIETNKKVFVLKLKGGHASESYTVEVMFDENRVLKRKLFDAIDPREVLQETNYYSPTPIE